MKRIVSVFLSIIMVLCVFTIVPFTVTAVTSGTCGGNATWTLTDDGVLVISGTGNMYNYTAGKSPWYNNGVTEKEIIINNGITSIGDYSFFGCSSVTSISLPDSLTSIGKYAFKSCSNTYIHIPEKVTSIGSSAFEYCHNLISVTIPDSVINLGDAAFDGCYNLTSVSIGESVSKIDKYTFEGCNKLKIIAIPDSITSIGQSAFRNCTNLTTLTIGKSVSFISKSAFELCKSLENIVIVSDNRSYDSRQNCNAIINSSTNTLITGCKNTIIPNSVTRIGQSAFSYCSDLKTISIPYSVTSIDSDAFMWCDNLSCVILNKSINSINSGAFHGCSNLKDVYYSGNENEWNRLIVNIGSYNNSILNAIIHTNSNNSEMTYITVLSTNKDMSVKIGEKMKLGFCLADNSTQEFDKNWKAMAIVNSDPTIISLSEYSMIESGYVLELTGLKPGLTHLTVSDTDTDISTTIEINVYDKYVNTYTYSATDVPTIYPNTKFARNTTTNLYDMNGIYISDYKCVPSTGGYNISFNAYNRNYYAAAIDIFDENGNWKSYEEIEKYESPTKSIWNIGSQLFYHIPYELSTNTLLTYKQSSFSKHTYVYFTLPSNCYFTISSNAFESPGVIIINSLDIAFDAMFDFVEAGVEGVDKVSAFSSFKDTAKEQIIEELSKKTDTILLDTLKSDLQKAIKRVGTDNIYENTHSEKICSVYATLMESTLLSGHINIKQMFKSATKMSESFVTKLGPIGAMIKAYFTTVKTYDKIMQANQMAGSANDTYATFYANISDGYIQNGVYVNTNGNIEADTVLQVFKINDSDLTQPLTNNSSKKSTLYNISFVKGEEAVQPNGKVQVHIAIPQGLKRNTCTIYRQEEDGSWTALDAYIEGNYLVFETDHFSLYTVVGEPEELTIITMPNKLDYLSGETIETEGMILEYAGEQITEGFICNPSVLSNETESITVSYGDLSTDFNVTVNPAVYVVGHSISLNGDIGINYYFDVPDEEVDNGEVNVDFAWTVDGIKKTHSITLCSGDKYDLGYKATCPVAVAEMTYGVTAVVTIDGVLQSIPDTYSAQKYAKVILNNENNFREKYIAAENGQGRNGEQRYNDLVTLVKTMLDYGTKAQIVFDRDTDHPANEGTDYFNDEDNPVSADMITITEESMDMDLSAYGLRYKGSTVVYLSETSIRHYYYVDNWDSFNKIKDSVTFDGVSVSYTEKDDAIYFEKKGVSASNLDTPYTLTIKDKSCKYAVNDYIRHCLESTKVSDNTKALVKATYRYNVAANAFFEV